MYYAELELPLPAEGASPCLDRLADNFSSLSDLHFNDLRFNCAQLFSMLAMTKVICEQGAWAYYSSGYHLHKPAGDVGPFPHYDQARQGTVLFALCKFSDKVNSEQKEKNELLKQTCYAFWKMRAETDPAGCITRVHESSVFEQLLKDNNTYLQQVAEQYANYLCQKWNK